MSQTKTFKTRHCRYGEKCRSLDGGKSCSFIHTASAPCRYGEKCRSLSGGRACKFYHVPSPETIIIREMVKFMKEQGMIHKHTTHVVCAIQYSRHAYTPIEKADKCVYTTIDGTEVFKNGISIGESCKFSNAHYGAMGQSYGGLEKRGILGEVRKLYFNWYAQHVFPPDTLEKLSEEIPTDGLFARPSPLEAHMTYCGN